MFRQDAHAEHFAVEGRGGLLGGGPATSVIPQSGAPVGGMRLPPHQTRLLEPADGMGDAGDGACKRSDALVIGNEPLREKAKQAKQFESGEGEVVGPQHRLRPGPAGSARASPR